MANVFGRIYDVLRADLEARLSRWETRVEDRRHRRAPKSEQQAKAPRSSGADSELAGYYSNLEVPYGSDLETVRASWRRLVRRYHPDLHGTDPEKQRVATELVKGLNHAFEQVRKRLEKR